MEDKYGSRYFFGSNEHSLLKKSLKFERIKKWKDYVIPLFTKDEYLEHGTHYIYRWKCVKCGNEFESEVIFPNENDESDLMKDMISVVTSFCCRLYGLRRAKNKLNKIKELVKNDNL